MGERLRYAIEQWETGSVRAFHRAMRDSGVRGSSYPTIHGYLQDRTKPTLEFLEAAAGVLGVRLDWLRSGEGPLSDGGPRGIQGIGDAEARRVHLLVLRRIGETFSEFPQLSSNAQARVFFTWLHQWEERSTQTTGTLLWPPSDSEVVEIADAVAQALAAPVRGLGVDLLALSLPQQDLFVEHICEGLRALITTTNRTGPSLRMFEGREGRRWILERDRRGR
jgi:transcriptional regulator with XRE-family HTH domain